MDLEFFFFFLSEEGNSNETGHLIPFYFIVFVPAVLDMSSVSFKSPLARQVRRPLAPLSALGLRFVKPVA